MGGMRMIAEAIHRATGGSWIGQGLVWLVILAVAMTAGAYLSQPSRRNRDK